MPRRHDLTSLAVVTQVPGEPDETIHVPVPPGPLTVAGLIRARAASEWDALAPGERATAGREAAPPARGDTPEPRTREESIRAALDAFRAGWFTVLVDDEPTMALDERLAPGPDTRIRFVRLYPGRTSG